MQVTDLAEYGAALETVMWRKNRYGDEWAFGQNCDGYILQDIYPVVKYLLNIGKIRYNGFEYRAGDGKGTIWLFRDKIQSSGSTIKPRK